MKSQRSLLALACATALLAAACGSDDLDTAASPPTTEAGVSPADTGNAGTDGIADGFPVTVETCGRAVTFDAAPASVVVGWPTIITTLDALGVGDAVIGYTSADLATAPATQAEAISPDFRTSREVMIATGLDMFLVNDESQVDGSEGNLGWDDLDQLDAHGYVLGEYCLGVPAPTSIDAVYDDITNLGSIFGVGDAATELVVDLRDRVDLAAASTSGLAGASTAVVQVFDGTLYALSGSYYAMIPAELGLESVFASLDANFAEISAEEVLTLAPDVIVLVYDGDETARQAAVDEVSVLLAAAPAVAEGRIATVQNGTLSGGGVSVIDMIVDVADQLSS
jgi:iron complex transport system substrate-binding protein